MIVVSSTQALSIINGSCAAKATIIEEIVVVAFEALAGGRCTYTFETTALRTKEIITY